MNKNDTNYKKKPAIRNRLKLKSAFGLIFRCNCATCFGDVVPQKKNDFQTKIINFFEIFSFCFSSVIRRLIQ
ncbi:MAG: hypothetical protein K9H26_01525, partial [Prolixibacteraceae bacterium]|nr:hypothetical protein [Prolixibacteraceae bacterium]